MAASSEKDWSGIFAIMLDEIPKLRDSMAAFADSGSADNFETVTEILDDLSDAVDYLLDVADTLVERHNATKGDTEKLAISSDHVPKKVKKTRTSDEITELKKRISSSEKEIKAKIKAEAALAKQAEKVKKAEMKAAEKIKRAEERKSKSKSKSKSRSAEKEKEEEEAFQRDIDLC